MVIQSNSLKQHLAETTRSCWPENPEGETKHGSLHFWIIRGQRMSPAQRLGINGAITFQDPVSGGVEHFRSAGGQSLGQTPDLFPRGPQRWDGIGWDGMGRDR